MCNWMNDPAFIGYAFECDEKEREKQERAKRQRDWLDVMSEEEEDDDDEDGW